MTQLDLDALRAAAEAARKDANEWDEQGYQGPWQTMRDQADAVDALINRLRKAEAASKWMPIETAPKDGERVLLCIDHGQWGDKIWTGLWANGWMVSYGKARAEPTHWQPLPAAPTSADSEGESNG